MTATTHLHDAPDASTRASMVGIAAGRFRMGEDRFYREERPVRTVEVEGFWIDRHPVTNRAFARFVEATGHVTLAERRPDAALYPGVDPLAVQAGSAVFRQPLRPISLRRPVWWVYVPGASWRHPEGPGSSIDSRAEHPVVHVALCDALAYATWAGATLPTEAQWEYAARGGLDHAVYAWGDELMPAGRLMANIWRGRFPAENLRSTPPGTEPVGGYPANGYGLLDMIGNVWEWTLDAFTIGEPPPECCAHGLEARTRRHVLKGGSFLCADNYCRRYRPAARMAQPADSPAANLGFRCVRPAGAARALPGEHNR